MAPPGYNIDIELLARLYGESGIFNCKRNDMKTAKWKKVAVLYSHKKNVPLINYKFLLKKWSKTITAAQKKKSNAKKSTKKTGGGPAEPPLDHLTELVLSVGQVNADLPSTTDCEINREEVNGTATANTEESEEREEFRDNYDDDDDDDDRMSTSVLQRAIDNETHDLVAGMEETNHLAASLGITFPHDGNSRMEEFTEAGSSGDILFRNTEQCE